MLAILFTYCEKFGKLEGQTIDEGLNANGKS